MKPMHILSTSLCVLGLAAFTACSDDVDVRTDSDTTTATMEGRGDTTSVGEAVGNAGQEVKDESIEKMVETALLAKPGFGEVEVESRPDGVIILNGTVATENEKAQAQVVAENTAGVKQVENNLTVR